MAGFSRRHQGPHRRQLCGRHNRENPDGPDQILYRQAEQAVINRGHIHLFQMRHQ